jgi:hypothetical protein
MRKARSTVAVVVLVGGLFGCGDNQEPERAEELLERIGADYRSWSRAPGYPGRESSSAPHGDAVEIYVNDVIAQALSAGEPLQAWPEGAIVAKDGFEDGDHTYLAVMEKTADGWFWVERIDSDVKYSGKPDLCINCHTSGDDYVRAFDLP